MIVFDTKFVAFQFGIIALCSRYRRVLFLGIFLSILIPTVGWSADWPMWRYDAMRSGRSPFAIPETLHQQWELELPAIEKAFPDASNAQMTFDDSYIPVVMGENLYICSPVYDSVTAYDTETGAVNWVFYADGPMRFAPACSPANGNIYCVSDDGYLYCLDGIDGSLVWKFRGAPNEAKILGNRRLCSTWPARGGPVLLDDKVYFSAGIWPFMGVFIYELNADTGAVNWMNDQEGARWMEQPHNTAHAFSGLAPQGYLVATDDVLLIPNGRAVAAGLDRNTGSLQFFNHSDNNKGGTGYVAAYGNHFNNSHSWFKLSDGSKDDSLADGAILISDQIASNYVGYLCMAGSFLYKGELGVVKAYQTSGGTVTESWQKPIEGTPKTMLAADNKLFVVTKEGMLYCFGETAGEPVASPVVSDMLVEKNTTWKYFKGTSFPGETWIDSGFDDSSWLEGASGIGYKITGLNTILTDMRYNYVTVYMRKEFAVSDKELFESLTFTVDYDDGFVAFLNGVEIARKGLSVGQTHLTTSTGHRSGNPIEIDVFPYLYALTNGTPNVLAIEIHNRSEDSSDLCMIPQLSKTSQGGFPLDQWTALAQETLTQTDRTTGYCLVVGAGSGRLMEELYSKSELNVIGLSSDPETVFQLRKKWQDLGIPAERLSIQLGTLATIELPPYIANLITSEAPADAGIFDDPSLIGKLFNSLRPYGGKLCLTGASDDLFTAARNIYPIPEVLFSDNGAMAMLSRDGALPGSADWSHQYADASHSVMGKDKLVKAPLGLLWFGGTVNDKILPRHGHGPSPVISAGRVYVLGPNHLTARDVYTGRLVWEKELQSVGSFFEHTSHESGANHIGSTLVAAPNGVYVCHNSDELMLLDADTGETVSSFNPPDSAFIAQTVRWKKMLITASDPFTFTSGDVGQNNWNETCSRDLKAINRFTGNEVWSHTANSAWYHNTIIVGNDIVYAIDRLAPGQMTANSRRGLPPVNTAKPFKLYAWHVDTGEEVWSTTNNVFGTWLGYSDEYDILIESTRSSRDMMDLQNDSIIAYRGSDGTVLWEQLSESGNDNGPYILHHDKIIKQGRNIATALDIQTGEPYKLKHPQTGIETIFNVERSYGCNTMVGSEHLLTFRSASAGYYDMRTHAGTGNFGGAKSGCSSSLLAANGVLNSIDYTRTCTCSYQNQTSMGLVHMPNAEQWTFSKLPSGGKIKQLGINFGAPGDRVSDSGTFWTDYPSVGGEYSPDVGVTISGNASYFRNHAAHHPDEKMAWVAGSGIQGDVSINVPLNNNKTFEVRLYFAEPDGLAAGDRVFSVSLEGALVAPGLDVAEQVGSDGSGYCLAFSGVAVDDGVLNVDMTAIRGTPVLSGIEVYNVEDDDGDGIPDQWEKDYFGDISTASGLLSSDQDGDGYCDLFEYIAGTNPMDIESVLEITQTKLSGEGLVINWQSVYGKKYDILSKTRLIDPEWDIVAEGIITTQNESSYTITVHQASTVFIKVKCQNQ